MKGDFFMKTTIQVKSTITLNEHTETDTYSVKGEWVRKHNGYYLQYNEPEEKLGHTRTVIRIGQDSVRLVRYGDVQMNMEFRPGESTRGSYRTAYGTLSIEALTLAYEVKTEQGQTKLVWSYDLQTNNETHGRYTMEVWIQEDVS
jgi:uncharacterized beta-barrel protein YwiB (DUF1934 family)